MLPLVIQQFRAIKSLKTLEHASKFYLSYEDQYYDTYGYEIESFHSYLFDRLVECTNRKDIKKVDKLLKTHNTTSDQNYYLNSIKTILTRCYEAKIAKKALIELQSLVYATSQLLMKHAQTIQDHASTEYQIILQTIGNAEEEENDEVLTVATNLSELRLLLLTKCQQSYVSKKEVRETIELYESICSKQLFEPLAKLQSQLTFWQRIFSFIKCELNRIKVSLRKPLEPKSNVNSFTLSSIVHTDAKSSIKRIRKRYDLSKFQKTKPTFKPSNTPGNPSEYNAPEITAKNLT